MKPGSVAAFTVWGRREESLLFTAQAEAKKRQRVAAGLPAEEEKKDDGPTETSNFDFGRDIDHWMGVFRQVGFNQVKRWF